MPWQPPLRHWELSRQGVVKAQDNQCRRSKPATARTRAHPPPCPSRLGAHLTLPHFISLTLLPRRRFGISGPQLEAGLQPLKKNREARESRMKQASTGGATPDPAAAVGSYVVVRTSSAYVPGEMGLARTARATHTAPRAQRPCLLQVQAQVVGRRWRHWGAMTRSAVSRAS
eukprot:COSAG05_NODE_971_length_6368_cov_3.026320_5_plen_172_part_00